MGSNSNLSISKIKQAIDRKSIKSKYYWFFKKKKKKKKKSKSTTKCNKKAMKLQDCSG